jgi:hypothetical protein
MNGDGFQETSVGLGKEAPKQATAPEYELHTKDSKDLFGLLSGDRVNGRSLTETQRGEAKSALERFAKLNDPVYGYAQSGLSIAAAEYASLDPKSMSYDEYRTARATALKQIEADLKEARIHMGDEPEEIQQLAA